MQIKPNNNHIALGEVGQTNPLRWVILHKEPDGPGSETVYQEETPEFKCKDFFNEVLAKYHGHKLSIYGFNAGELSLNEEGVYVLLKNIHDMEVFTKNIGLVSTYAEKFGGTKLSLEPIDDTNAVMLLPRWYFQNTFYISLLTYLIRISNVTQEIKDETFMEHPSKAIDNPFSAVYREAVAHGFSKMPVDTFFYVGEGDYYTKPSSGYVHNCGVNGWIGALKANKKWAAA